MNGLFFVFIYAFIITKKKNNKILLNAFSEKIISRRGGFDERFNRTSDENSEILITFQKNLVKMNLLKKLQSSHIGEAEKLKEIEKYQNDNYELKYFYNSEAGGLYDDWNFNIEE